MIGKNISHYRILEKLGEGGMGIVYKAQDTKLDRLVALKFLPSDLTRDDEAKKRFIQEAKAASTLQHHNICTIHDIDEMPGGQIFIVMDCYEGETLREKIKRGPLKIEEAVDISMQIAQGLSKAHEKSIVHRDIKPANIFITKDGITKIVDFGLAKLVGRTILTKVGTTIGTVAYMSPEQSKGEAVDHRTDIWSLGVVLYETITGQPPFKGEYDKAVIYSIVNEEPEAITGLRTGVPMELERIVHKCLEKQFSDRYQHVDELFADLRGIKKKMESDSTRTPTRMVSRRLRIRSKKVLVMIPICIVGILAVLAFYHFTRKDSKHYSRRVVVAIFENQTGDKSLDYVGKMAADWLTQGLTRTGFVEVVPTDISFVATQKVQTLAKKTESGIVISGTYYKQAERMRFQEQIMDVRRKRLLHSLDPISVPLDSLLQAITQLRHKTMGALAMVLDERLSTWSTSGNSPPTFEAYRKYFDGYTMFLDRKWPQAIVDLKIAYKLDTTFVLPVLLCALAHLNLRQYSIVDSITQAVIPKRSMLSQSDRCILDILLAYITGDKLKSYAATKELIRITPLSPHTYQHALDAMRINRPQEAINTLKGLNPEKVGMPSWFYFWYVLIQSAHMLGDYKQEAEYAKRGRIELPNDSNMILYSIPAFAAMGNLKEVEKLIDNSKSLPPDSVITEGVLLTIAAREFRAHGNREISLRMANKAVELYKDHYEEITLNPSKRIGVIQALAYAERWPEAKAEAERLLKEDVSNVDGMCWLGTLCARVGEKEKAIQMDKQLRNFRKRYLFGQNTYGRACIAALLDNKAYAMELLREASAQGLIKNESIPCFMIEYIYCDINLETLRDYPQFKEFIKPR